VEAEEEEEEEEVPDQGRKKNTAERMMV
jgi:hypothetical protein